MLTEGILEIKLAIIKSAQNRNDNNALFHQKIGILTDYHGNKISFSGSINETASGWLKNVEEFKVFKSWEMGQDKYLNEDIERFEAFWNNEREHVDVIALPEAIKQHLIRISDGFSKENFITLSYFTQKKQESIDEQLSLFPYQQEALNKWKGNDFSLLFEMATGTGKTRTAIACMNEFLKGNETALIIIACPQVTLSQQWQTEIESFNFDFNNIVIACGTNPKWKDDLYKALKSLSVGFHKRTIVYTTHSTCSNIKFIELIKANIKKTKVCFIGDEAHGLGATQTKKALLEEYESRIGLSATPSRWFDDDGTQALIAYFGNTSFEFGIKEALHTINPLTNKPFLVEFEYYPIFISLTMEELEEYQRLTKRLSKLANSQKEEAKKKFEQLLFTRANIEKNASLKYTALETILQKKKLSNTIIFVSSEQMDNTLSILSKYQVIAHKFTQEQGTKVQANLGGISERQYLINRFKCGDYQALVAIKCLDEGIDIPSSDTAILMASSTNPREYIQRIGRVIRQAKNKRRAYIYDLILAPDFNTIQDLDLKNIERKIFKKELVRVQDMSSNAINNAYVLDEINQQLRRVYCGD